MDWELFASVAILIGTQVGLFLWLRNDIQQLRNDMDERLRTVEREQARMSGLLEGMGFTGKTSANA